MKRIIIPGGRMNRVCKTCSGSGDMTCPRCVGYGTFENGETCYYCKGDGTVTCTSCNGYGYIDD